MKTLEKKLLKELNEYPERGLFVIYIMYTKESKVVVLDSLLFPLQGEERGPVGMTDLLKTTQVMNAMSSLNIGLYKIEALQESYIKDINDFFITPIYIMEYRSEEDKEEDTAKMRESAVKEMSTIYWTFVEEFKKLDNQNVYSLYDIPLSVKVIDFN